jgi:hypothetical protein
VQKESHCPFGCGVPELNETGYCRHLVGFTNDGKTLEPVVDDVNGFTGKPTGLKTVKGHNTLTGENHCQDVLPTDRLVNPEFEQLVNGVKHRVKKWVSARVYRRCPEEANVAGQAPAPQPAAPQVTVVPETAPPAWAADLLAGVNSLRERLDAVEARVGAATSPPPPEDELSGLPGDNEQPAKGKKRRQPEAVEA